MTPIDMWDAIHANVASIPLSAEKVLGYISGTPEIEWTDADWSLFPRSGHDRMEQGYTLTQGNVVAATSFDVERGALTPAQIPAIVHTRIAHRIKWTCVYGSDSFLADVEKALIGAENIYGRGWYYGHVQSHLADWSLTRAEAVALLGKEIHGLGCVAVQWDHQANTDVSVTDPAWLPAPAPPPVPWQVTALGELATAAERLGQAVALLKANGG